jgi:hypothetical protein
MQCSVIDFVPIYSNTEGVERILGEYLTEDERTLFHGACSLHREQLRYRTVYRFPLCGPLKSGLALIISIEPCSEDQVRISNISVIKSSVGLVVDFA